jgi:regulator of replication initiation timing
MHTYFFTFLVIVALAQLSPSTAQAQEPTRKEARPAEVRQIQKSDRPEQIKLRTTEVKNTVQKVEQKVGQVRQNSKEAVLETKQLKEDAQALRQNFTEEQRAHFEQIKMEQKERGAEKLQLIQEKRDTAVAGIKEGMSDKLQSRNVIARLKGAEFTINESTNTVTVITPSGETRELNHLPDQVVARLIEKKALSETDQVGELELRSTDTGFEYHTTVPRKKKFLGLISRTVESEVIVDDATGDVSEQVKPGETPFARFLNSLSF